MLLYTRPHATIYVSSYYYICVLINDSIGSNVPFAEVVLAPLCVACPPQTTFSFSFSFLFLFLSLSLFFFPSASCYYVYVLMPLTCVLKLLCMCPHTITKVVLAPFSIASPLCRRALLARGILKVEASFYSVAACWHMPAYADVC